MKNPYKFSDEIRKNTHLLFYEFLKEFKRRGISSYKVLGHHLHKFDENMKEITIDEISINSRMLLTDITDLKSLFVIKFSDGDITSCFNLDEHLILSLSIILSEMINGYYKNKIIKTKKKKIYVENKDIIITDPCYIIKNKEESEEYKKARDEYYNFTSQHKEYDLIEKNGWDGSNLTPSQILEAYQKEREYRIKEGELKRKMDSLRPVSDWEKCNRGDKMDVLGIKNCLISNTIYGDWSCTTFDTDTKEKLGEFCADAGMVGVFELDEVLEYNPDFDYHTERLWTTTLIKNFTGTISIEIEHTEGVYEDDTEYHKKGEKWEDDSVHVVGKGNINFRTSQTGF